MKNKVSILTLGCKVNKYESDCLAKKLQAMGFFVSSDLINAEYYILNTCAVTNEAEKKSRQYISKIIRVNPNAKILVCGCASDADKQKFLDKTGVVAVFDNQRKDLIIDYFENKLYEDIRISGFNYNLVDPKIDQARAYIKIQDGCNRFCSYCIIPYLRGRSVSRSIESVVTEANQLSKDYNEIVLVGIDLSDYKIDGRYALPELLEKLSNCSARIRLGSLEVSVVTEELLSVLKDMSNFAPQFHLSLQSGDDDVLKAMNRKYTAQEYINACNMIYKYFPNANITTDIIVGFPGEKEENFNNTINLAKTVKFGKIHCFPFSAKKGTRAATFVDNPADIKKDRMDRLSVVASELQTEYNIRFIGADLMMLLEEKEGEYIVGYSENYIKCYLMTTKNLKLGEVIRVKGVELYKEGLKVRYDG